MPQVLLAGLSTIDIQYFVDKYPESNQKVKCDPPEILVGGPAANAAVAFSYLNGDSHLLTAIGNHPFRPYFENDFLNFGVQTIDFISGIEVEPVMASVVTNFNGERTILSHHPKNHCVDYNPAEILNKIKPELVFVDGFYPHMTVELCKAAKRIGIPIIFDGGSWKDHLIEVIPYLDIAICSADFRPPNTNTEKEVLDFFVKNNIGKIAISRGERPIICCEDGVVSEIQVSRHPIVDSLGAGDFLHGAFCYYWLQSRNFKESLHLASQFASATCQYKGTRAFYNKLDRKKFQSIFFHNL
ncbi:PfkB family carbohydrate kinase [Mangrovibacterium sp.]|uniref:PfkB family carbohydrate kinase n=1 Tax=Mangrovibacterium sp. TaxID=1961364 RepID=UPI003562DBF2